MVETNISGKLRMKKERNMATKEKTKEEVNTELADEHAIRYTYTEGQHRQHVKDIIAEYEFDKSKETELQLFGEDFLKTEEEIYVKVPPSKTNEGGIKKVFPRVNIAEILLRMSETLEKINSSLINISYRIEEK
jgi:hypothetical protein